MSIPRTPQDIVSIEMKRRVEDGEPSLTSDERRAILSAPDAVEAEQRRRFIANMEELSEDEEEEARAILRSSGGEAPSRGGLRPISVTATEALARRAKADPVVQRFESLRASRGRRLGAWEKHVLLTGQIPRDAVYEDEEPEEEAGDVEPGVDEAPARKPRRASRRAKTLVAIAGGALLLAVVAALGSEKAT